MHDSTLTPVDLTQLELVHDVKAGLDAIRRLLLESPSEFSILTAGAALDQVSLGLIALNAAILDPSAISLDMKQQLLELQSLSVRTQSLYRQASTFYSGLAAESIKNGAWDAAAYSPEGDWVSPAAQNRHRIATEG